MYKLLSLPSLIQIFVNHRVNAAGIIMLKAVGSERAQAWHILHYFEQHMIYYKHLKTVLCGKCCRDLYKIDAT